MKRINFNSPAALVEEINRQVEQAKDKFYVAAVFGRYNIIREIFEEFIKSGVHIDTMINLSDDDIDFYMDEFELSVTKNGVMIIKAKLVDKYIGSEGELAYVHEDCNSKLLERLVYDKTYEFSYNEDDDEDECPVKGCKDTCCADRGYCGLDDVLERTERNGRISPDDLCEVEDVFFRELRSSLLNWCEVMDDMNELLKRNRW